MRAPAFSARVTVLIRAGDVHPQVRRGGRPVRCGVEQHDDGLADLDLGVTDPAVLAGHPGSRCLDGAETAERKEISASVSLLITQGVDVRVAHGDHSVLFVFAHVRSEAQRSDITRRSGLILVR